MAKQQIQRGKKKNNLGATVNHKLKKKKSHWDVKAETQIEINVKFSTILSTLNKISDSNAYLFSDA